MKRLFIIFVLIASANAQVIFQTVAGSAQAQVATPTVDHGTGSYVTSVTVTISDATSGATIKYCTTNGCNPSSGSTYSTPITFSGAGTYYLNAMATKAGMTNSANMAQQTYTVTAGGGGSISAINQYASGALSGATTNKAFSVSAGHNVLVMVFNYPNTTAPTITDDGSGGANTYTLISGSDTTTSGTYTRVRSYLACNAHAATTLTITATGVTSGEYVFVDFSGGTCASDVTPVFAADNSGTNAAPDSGSITTSSAVTMVCSGYASEAQNRYSSFTGAGGLTWVNVGTFNQGVAAMQCALTASAGTFHSTFTMSSGFNWVAETVAIK